MAERVRLELTREGPGVRSPLWRVRIFRSRFPEIAAFLLRPVLIHTDRAKMSAAWSMASFMTCVKWEAAVGGARNAMMKMLIPFALVGCLVLGLAAPTRAQQAQLNPAIAARMIALVNQARKEAGLPAVALNANLTRAAQALAEDLAARRILSHQDSKGAGLDARLVQASYIAAVAVELVAGGRATVEETVTDWMSNPDNHETLLTAAVSDAGVGYFVRADETEGTGLRYYWVLDMAEAVERGPGP